MVATKFAGALTAALLVMTAISAPPAHAQWYVSGNVGASFLSDADATDTVGALVGKGDASFDTGFGLSGAIGHAWGPVRLEGELSYRKNNLDQLNGITINGFLIPALGPVNLGGDVSSFGFMANGYYDFDTGGKWVPFLMAGIGGARLNLDVTSVASVATTYDESDTVFAYQVGAGIGYKFTPSTIANLSYRFFGTSDPTFNDGVDKVEGEYRSHNIWAGITVKF